VQVTEIRQASPFSETKTAAKRVPPQRGAGGTSPVFELPSAERSATARSDAARDVASARNAERAADRAADKNEKLTKPSSGRAHHGHAHESVRGAKRQADIRSTGTTDKNPDQVGNDPTVEAGSCVAEDTTSQIADNAVSDAASAAPAEASAADATQEASGSCPDCAIPLAAVAIPAVPGATGQQADAALADPAVLAAANAETATSAALLAIAPQTSSGAASTVAGSQAETIQSVASAAAVVSPKIAGSTTASDSKGSVGEKADDLPADETDRSGQLAKTEIETRPIVGKSEKDQQAQAADGKPAPEAKIPVDVPAVARDARFELPPGFSLPAPKAAHDLHAVGGPEQISNGLPQAAEGRPTPISAVPLEIGLRAMSGNKRFDIRLDPAELGRVDVRLDIDDAGTVTAKLTVDRVETLHLLQRDARTLERAFEQAGLRPSDGGVDISLRDQSGQQGSGQTGRDNSEQNSRRSRAFLHIEPEIAETQVLRRATGPGRIDLSI
jgi:flagellar hook-length control protein FliK